MNEINEMINQYLEERFNEYILEEAEKDKDESKDEDLAVKMSKEIEHDLREFKKGYSSLMHSIRIEDLSEARSKYKSLKKDLSEIEAKIEKMPELPEDNTKGKRIARKLALLAFGISAVAATAGAISSNSKLLAGGFVGIFGSITALALTDTFKGQMCRLLAAYQTDMDDAIDSLIKSEHDAVKRQNTSYSYNKNHNINSEVNQESVDDTIIDIYNAYESGIITESAMNNLIDKISNKKDSDQKKITDNSYNDYSSNILNPDKLFKDRKYSYINMSQFHDIDNREDIQKLILTCMKNFLSAVNKEIDSMYDNWYDEDDKYTKSQVKDMAKELFDYIGLVKSNREGFYWIEFGINNSARHKKSDDFFGCHGFEGTYEIDIKTGKLVKTYDVSFAG